MTQNPADIPETVLAQLGNRVQHALRAYTPKEQKAVKVAAQSFRKNPKLDTERVITELGKGEALTSFLEGNGVPAMVDRTLIRPPSANVGPVTGAQRKAIINKSPVKGQYDTEIDRESAYEKLQGKADTMTQKAGTEADDAAFRWRYGRYRRFNRRYFRHQPQARRAALVPDRRWPER